MEQMHLVVYLESKGCYEVRKDKNGMFVMRNKANEKMSGVPVPSSADGKFKEATICRICKSLEVEIPPTSSKDIEDMMIRINEDVKKRIQEENTLNKK